MQAQQPNGLGMLETAIPVDGEGYRPLGGGSGPGDPLFEGQLGQKLAHILVLLQQLKLKRVLSTLNRLFSKRPRDRPSLLTSQRQAKRPIQGPTLYTKTS